jgi:hypothetical protein
MSTEYIVNPNTGRPIKVGGRTYNVLIAESSNVQSTESTKQQKKTKKVKKEIVKAEGEEIIDNDDSDDSISSDTEYY